MSDVKMTGPLFDGRAVAAMKDFQEDLKKKIAEFANEAAHKNFSVFKNPTGYYESRVSVERNELVTDHGVVYGSWLERGGEGFSGYHSFEMAFKEANDNAEIIGERLLSTKYLRRMN